MFNGRARVALLFLTGSLVVGAIVALLDYGDPRRFEDFHVVHGAVPVPQLALADEGAAAAGVPTERQPLALNSATQRELMLLPLIGPKTAALILQHRDQHGPFAAVESLAEIKGIGPRTLERLRPLVVLE